MGDPELVLCYINGPWAYFTSQSLDKQTGDDWNDAPYEHNAGTPYEWMEYMGTEKYEIIRIAWDGPFDTPEDRGLDISVDRINAGESPWLMPNYDHSRLPVMVRGGMSIEDFIQIVEDGGGTVYLPMPKDEALEILATHMAIANLKREGTIH